MNGPWSPRLRPLPPYFNQWLLLAGIAALILRGWPLRAGLTPWPLPADFDEGVYFASAALWVQGVLPYRDFVFVHPPGIVYLMSWAAAWGEPLALSDAFSLGRLLSPVLGAASAVMVGRLAGRFLPAPAALLAALLYASGSEVVSVERGIFLEPALNVLCLAMASLTLGAVERDRVWLGIVGAGLCAGAAVAMKWWALLWVLVACGLLLHRRRFGLALAFALACIFVGGLLIVPLALQAPQAFFEQTVMLQLWRPGDRLVGVWSRVPYIFGGRRPVAALLAVLGFVSTLRHFRKAQPAPQIYFAAMYALTVVAFFAAASYWPQYNAHLAASEMVLAGCGAAALVRFLAQRLSWLGQNPALTGVLTVSLALPSFLQVVLEMGQARSMNAPVVPSDVPEQACVLAFEPAWLLAANRLPAAPFLVDSYGSMLLDAVKTGQRFTSATEAFHSAPAQRHIREVLQSCRFVLLGERGRRQLSEATLQWLNSRAALRPGSGDELFETKSDP
jgi:hypothetical protein